MAIAQIGVLNLNKELECLNHSKLLSKPCDHFSQGGWANERKNE